METNGKDGVNKSVDRSTENEAVEVEKSSRDKVDTDIIKEPLPENNNPKGRTSIGKVIRVSCGYKNCQAKPMLLQNLRTHTQEKHHGIFRKEKHQEVALLTKGQTKVESFFLPTKRPETEVNEEASNSSNNKKKKLSHETEEKFVTMDQYNVEQEEIQTTDKQKELMQEKLLSNDLITNLLSKVESTIKTTIKEQLQNNDSPKEEIKEGLKRQVKTKRCYARD